MSELEELEVSITTSLDTITTNWDALLAIATPGAIQMGQKGGSNSTRGVPAHDPETDPLGVMVADDHLDSEADIDKTTRVVSLRRYITDVLNGWSRLVMEERPVKVALPDGLSAPSMAEFLTRHAEWISWHDTATDCADELAKLARQISSTTNPQRKDYVYLGDCPFVIADLFCAGRVRSRIGGDGEATCSDCGQTAMVEWWEDVLGITPDQIMGAMDLAKILHDRLHVTVGERTIRNWARDGRIPAHTPFGPQPLAPRWWFDPRAVLDSVARMDRECPKCGRMWQGFGDVCSRCYKDTQEAKPSWAQRKGPTRAPISLRPRRVVVADSHDTDRPTRCHFSDLPTNQCACGRRHEGIGA